MAEVLILLFRGSCKTRRCCFLSPRGTSGERIEERGIPGKTRLLSPALSSIRWRRGRNTAAPPGFAKASIGQWCSEPPSGKKKGGKSEDSPPSNERMFAA